MDYRIEGKRLYIDKAPVSMFSGSFQYWRVAPELWAGILDKVQGMGFGIVETYMPWSVHEVARGRFDFGETDPRLDLPRFLGLCRSAGIKVLARPGPHINAELTWFGYPRRLFADEELLARCSDGTPVILPAIPRMFPIPCYHHPRFQDEARVYLEALAAALGGADAIHPGGPVIAVQVDNECARFLRAHPFDQDYSEYSVRLYRRFLEEKYGTLEALSRAHREEYEAWSLVDPPRRFSPGGRDELPRHLDWVEFGEYYINEALRVFARMLRGCFGDGVPLFHNYPVTLPLPPLDMAGAEAFLDWQGVDMYPRRSQYHALRWGMKYTTTMSRFPMLVEFGSGSTCCAPALTFEDQEFTTRAALMHGIKGINFYMTVERERWYGSPVKRDGTVREKQYGFYRDLLAEVRGLGLEDMTPHRPVILLVNREYERLASAATLLSPASRLVDMFVHSAGGAADLLISDERFGLSERVAVRYARMLSFWYWALSAAGVHFAVGDTGCSAEMLGGYKVAVAPTFEYMDEALQRKLLGFAEAGGALVVGPRAPRLDSSMEPCRVLAAHMLEPGEVRAPADALGVPVDELALYPDGHAEPGTPGRLFYAREVGGGSIIHLGLVPGEVTCVRDGEPFGPLVETIIRAAGVEPCFVPADPSVDVSLFDGGVTTVVMVANPTGERIDTLLSTCGDGALTDSRTGRSLERSGNGPIELSLEPFSMTVIEQARARAGA